MSKLSFDVIVPKKYESQTDGQTTKKTAWNKVGRAWLSKSGKSISFELYLLPNERYVIQLTDTKPENTSETSKEAL